MVTRILLILFLAGCGVVEQKCKDGVKARLDADCTGNGCIVVPSGQSYMACYLPPSVYVTCDPRQANCPLAMLTCTEVP